MLVWKGPRHFLQTIREKFGKKMTQVFAQFPIEKCLSYFEKKNNFTSKSSSGHIECNIDNTLEKFCQN